MPKLNESRASLESTYAQGPAGLYVTGTRPCREWSRGYYCAVACLLRESGAVTTDVLSLFKNGGSPQFADPEDLALFKAYGLMDASRPVPSP